MPAPYSTVDLANLMGVDTSVSTPVTPVSPDTVSASDLRQSMAAAYDALAYSCFNIEDTESASLSDNLLAYDLTNKAFKSGGKPVGSVQSAATVTGNAVSLALVNNTNRRIKLTHSGSGSGNKALTLSLASTATSTLSLYGGFELFLTQSFTGFGVGTRGYTIAFSNVPSGLKIIDAATNTVITTGVFVTNTLDVDGVHNTGFVHVIADYIPAAIGSNNVLSLRVVNKAVFTV